MLAVVAVFATHLWGWPRGGEVGIDVFFVLSGYLVTESLLRNSENATTVSVRRFYWKRVRRILPSATVVLLLTYGICLAVLPAQQSRSIGLDTLFAYIGAANWHFAATATAPAVTIASASPLQHFWALSVGEQFWVAWPVMILAVSLITARKASGVTLATLATSTVVVAASLGWATYEATTSPRWAYFSTLARFWEFGVGALLAAAAGTLVSLPAVWRPVLSWAGVTLIVAAVLVVADDTSAVPVPWLLIPVAGTALVIAAGVGGEPRLQVLLSNRLSTYLGDLSYALFLVHLPVIVLIGTVMSVGLHYYVCVLAVTFGMAIALHHCVERPLRTADLQVVREAREAYEHGLIVPDRSSKIAALAALFLLTAGLIVYSVRPDAYSPPPPPQAPAPVTGPVGDAF